MMPPSAFLLRLLPSVQASASPSGANRGRFDKGWREKLTNGTTAVTTRSSRRQEPAGGCFAREPTAQSPDGCLRALSFAGCRDICCYLHWSGGHKTADGSIRPAPSLCGNYADGTGHHFSDSASARYGGGPRRLRPFHCRCSLSGIVSQPDGRSLCHWHIRRRCLRGNARCCAFASPCAYGLWGERLAGILLLVVDHGGRVLAGARWRTHPHCHPAAGRLGPGRDVGLLNYICDLSQ